MTSAEKHIGDLLNYHNRLTLDRLRGDATRLTGEMLMICDTQRKELSINHRKEVKA